MAEEKLSTKRKVQFTVALVLIFIVLALMLVLATEIAARVALSVRRGSSEFLVYGLKPPQAKKQRLKLYIGPDQGSYYKSIPSSDPRNPVNSTGFRGPEISAKKAGVHRIICLGASTTYGDKLDYADTYPAMLQKQLDSRYGPGKYEVINAGVPGLDLKQIIPLVKAEVISLQPDTVVLMSINNNFKAPGFWFVGMDDPLIGGHMKDKPLSRKNIKLRLRDFFVRKLVLGYLWNKTFRENLLVYFKQFDWQGFAAALTSPDNIWEAGYVADLGRLIGLIRDGNPRVKILLLGQAINSIVYTPMLAPFERARGHLRQASDDSDHVYYLDVHAPILQAAGDNESVWLSPKYDPLHLSGTGNDILARAVANFLSAQNSP